MMRMVTMIKDDDDGCDHDDYAAASDAADDGGDDDGGGGDYGDAADQDKSLLFFALPVSRISERSRAERIIRADSTILHLCNGTCHVMSSLSYPVICHILSYVISCHMLYTVICHMSYCHMLYPVICHILSFVILHLCNGT